jgi:hypothetical protein
MNAKKMGRRTILAAAALTFAAALTMTGCDRKYPIMDCYLTLEVKNETDTEIRMTNGAPAGVGVGNRIVTIAPGQSGIVMFAYDSGSGYMDDAPLKDRFEADDILPFGNSLTGRKHRVSMTVAGAAVDGGVWTRRHWTFRADGRNRVYSLTVTGDFIDGFIDKLEPSPDPDKGQVDLYDKDKKAAAYVDYDDEATVFTWDGLPAACFVRPEFGEVADYMGMVYVYGFNGKFLGWYRSGVMYDMDGRAVGAKAWIKTGEISTITATPGAKGIKRMKPVKHVKEVPSVPHIPTDRWSETSLADFLAAGMVE